MRFIITKEEIVSCSNVRQTLLQCLKDKGAPVEGKFILDFDDEKWNVTQTSEPDGTVIFDFEAREGE